ncbi:MAG: hypothetical protein ACFE9D_06910 [Promethearchaeota archaeon]
MKDEEANPNYRNEAAKMRTALATVRTLEAIRRTKLAELRTGISILAITLSILTILITTSAFWDPSTVFYLLLMVAAMILFLLGIGAYFFYRGLHGMREIDKRRERLSIDIDSLDETYHKIFNEA